MSEENKKLIRPTKSYLVSYKKQIVAEAEQIGSIKMVAETHKIPATTMHEWMTEYGSISYHQHKKTHRTPEQREEIIRAVLSEKLTLQEAAIKYKVKKVSSIRVWIREYNKQQQQLVEGLPPIDVEEQQTLSSADLKGLELAELKIRALEIMLDIASKEFKVDIRKKFGAKQ